MNAGENSTILSDTSSFSSVLDDACSRLWDRKVRYSLRRIGELDEILEKTERELDEILLHRGDLLTAARRAPLPAASGSPAPEKLPIQDRGA
jgi:hypothetical protein